MEELHVNVKQTAGSVQWNFEDLKARLQSELHSYETAVYNDDSIKSAKEDVAELRKLKKSVESRRKEIKSNCLAPYLAIETQAEELVTLIDKPIMLIDSQIAEYEKKRKAEKKAEIILYIDQNASDLPPKIETRLKFKYYDNRWENATCTAKTWKTAVDTAIHEVRKELSLIRNIDPDFMDIAMDKYKERLDITDTFQTVQQAQRQQEIIRENERRRNEAEKRRLEEEKRNADIEKSDIRNENVPDVEKSNSCTESEPKQLNSDTSGIDPQKEEQKQMIIKVTGTQQQLVNVLGYIKYIGARWEDARKDVQKK